MIRTTNNMSQKKKIFSIIKKAAIATVISMSSVAMGAANFTGTTAGNLSPRATFDVSGEHLKVTLLKSTAGNTSGKTPTATFLNLVGEASQIRTSANVTAGSAVYLVGTGLPSTARQSGFEVGRESTYLNSQSDSGASDGIPSSFNLGTELSEPLVSGGMAELGRTR